MGEICVEFCKLSREAAAHYPPCSASLSRVNISKLHHKAGSCRFTVYFTSLNFETDKQPCIICNDFRLGRVNSEIPCGTRAIILYTHTKCEGNRGFNLRCKGIISIHITGQEIVYGHFRHWLYKNIIRRHIYILFLSSHSI